METTDNRGQTPNKGKASNFVLRVKDRADGDKWKPAYTLPDATSEVQGGVWLSDTPSDSSAANGITAATPKAVKSVQDQQTKDKAALEEKLSQANRSISENTQAQTKALEAAKKEISATITQKENTLSRKIDETKSAADAGLKAGLEEQTQKQDVLRLKLKGQAPSKAEAENWVKEANKTWTIGSNCEAVSTLQSTSNILKGQKMALSFTDKENGQWTIYYTANVQGGTNWKTGSYSYIPVPDVNKQLEPLKEKVEKNTKALDTMIVGNTNLFTGSHISDKTVDCDGRMVGAVSWKLPLHFSQDFCDIASEKVSVFISFDLDMKLSKPSTCKFSIGYKDAKSQVKSIDVATEQLSEYHGRFVKRVDNVVPCGKTLLADICYISFPTAQLSDEKNIHFGNFKMEVGTAPSEWSYSADELQLMNIPWQIKSDETNITSLEKTDAIAFGGTPNIPAKEKREFVQQAFPGRTILITATDAEKNLYHLYFKADGFSVGMDGSLAAALVNCRIKHVLTTTFPAQRGLQGPQGEPGAPGKNGESIPFTISRNYPQGKGTPNSLYFWIVD